MHRVVTAFGTDRKYVFAVVFREQNERWLSLETYRRTHYIHKSKAKVDVQQKKMFPQKGSLEFDKEGCE